MWKVTVEFYLRSQVNFGFHGADFYETGLGFMRMSPIQKFIQIRKKKLTKCRQSSFTPLNKV
jgi:hypothetical protein